MAPARRRGARPRRGGDPSPPADPHPPGPRALLGPLAWAGLSPLNLEDRALVGEVDRAAEARLGFASRPELVHLVGHVRQQHALYAGGARVLAGLARRQV